MNFLTTWSGARIAASSIDVIHPPIRPVGREPLNYQLVEFHIGGEAREERAWTVDVDDFLADEE